MAEKVVCVIPHNGTKVHVAVRLSEPKVQIDHPAAGWIDVEVFEECLKGSSVQFLDESGDQVTLRAKSTNHLHISKVVLDR